MRWQWLLVAALALLLRLPFLDQAIQGDDVYYLAGAQHAQIDPAHPNHGRYVFLGRMVDMRGHPHPPLNAWSLAALLALVKDIREPVFHLAYALFSVIAALSVFSLARRFTSRPLVATLLFMATPAFVVNGNSFESDIPFVAFWLASAALFAGAVARRSMLLVGLSCLAMVLTALAAYQSVVLIPVLGAFLLLRRERWLPAWFAILTPAVTLALWQLFERFSTGALPASVLAGYFHSYGWQALSNKLKNAAALTVHTAWIVFPLLAAAAFLRRSPRWLAAIAALGMAGGIWVDAHPLFWASGGIGLLVVLECIRTSLAARGTEDRVLAAWVAVFFAAALVLFFAGSARYLLPIAAPVALLVTRALHDRPRWLLAGFCLQLLLSLALSFVNYQHWDGYRAFVRDFRQEFARQRVWINGEWGLRYYAEAEGGLPMVQGQAVQPGDIVLTSRLAFPIHFTTGGGELAPLAEREIRPAVPLRLIGLNSRSAYSTVSLGYRPFDFSRAPLDVVRADVVMERLPQLSYLPMNAPAAESQILSGVYQLEFERWRWTGERAVLLLKPPSAPSRVRAVMYVPEQAPAARVRLTVDGVLVAEGQCASAATCEVLSEGAVSGAGTSATLILTVDRTFSVPGDHRRLGVILTEAGFVP